MPRWTTLLAFVAACSPREHETGPPGLPELDCPAPARAPVATPAAEPASDPAPTVAEPEPPASAPEPERCVGVPSPALARAEKDPPTSCCVPDRALIQRTIEARRPRYQTCFEKGLRRDPALAGRLRVRFAIEPEGEVVRACAEAPSLADAETVDCVLRAFTTLRFAGYSEAICGPPTITYPLEMRPR